MQHDPRNFIQKSPQGHQDHNQQKTKEHGVHETPPKTMSKSNHTDLTVVLDRSGSMGVVAPETIKGFNSFLADQKKGPGTATITLNQFNHRFERVIDAQNVVVAFPLTSETFVTKGNTALLDAIGKSIVDTGARLNAMPEDKRPGKVIVVIITDGEENDSHEFSRAQINQMIDHQQDTYQWEFVFLGANQDAIREAAKIGIGANSSITYAHNPIGTAMAFSALSVNTSSLRSGLSSTMDWSDADREEQKKAGAI